MSNRKLADAANKAMRLAYAEVEPVSRFALAGLVGRWVETGIDTFVDDAVLYCELHDLPIKPELLRHLAAAARLRRRPGPSQAVREGIKDRAFTVMANLVIHGATNEQAASKAARWINSQKLGRTLKASTLEKQYGELHSGKNGPNALENVLRQSWLDDPNAEASEAWTDLVRDLPLADDDERGERR